MISVSRRPAAFGSIGGMAAGVSLAATGMALAAWSWRKWPDLLVDFGQQLYVPWRVTLGERLHLEIAFLHGPLSQHVHALWFALFGPSLTVLIVSNLAVLALLTWITYRLARLCAGRLAATIAGLVLLCGFGFAQYVGTGNYNFIAPYTHESTHGVTLAAGMILALSLALTRGGRWHWTLAGLLLGLAMLTKVEVGLAAVAAATLGVVAGFVLKEIRRADLLRFLAAAVAPLAVFFVYFLSYLPASAALRAVGGGLAALSREVAANPFYRRVAGFDNPIGNLGHMLAMFGLVIALCLIGIAADTLTRRAAREPAAVGLAVGVLLFVVLMLRPDVVPWREIPRALPLTTAAILALMLALLWRWRRDPGLRKPIVPAALCATFALALLSKAALNLHLYHYGFYLALPATLVLVIAVVEWIPGMLQARFGCGIVFRCMAIALVAVGMVYHVHWSHEFYRLKTLPVGSGGDTIVTYDPALSISGPATSEALAWLAENTSPEDTLVGFPEGIMLNYLARRATRTTCMNFMMTEMILHGEQPLLDELRSDPPDFVLLVHKNTAEFGVGYFGRDPRYGRAIMDWVEENYDARVLFGNEPLRDDRFGIKILERKRGS